MVSFKVFYLCNVTTGHIYYEITKWKLYSKTRHYIKKLIIKYLSKALKTKVKHYKANEALQTKQCKINLI